MELKEKKILIVGLAKSGVAAAKAAISLGAVVSGYDRKKFTGIDPEAVSLFSGTSSRLLLGGTEPLDDEKWDMLVLSPGVPVNLGFVKKAEENGAEIIGELELAWRLSRAAYVAVTGTNGKTTTTTLIGEIFNKSGRKAKTAGNIGIPVVTLALEEEMNEDAWLITEVSSFQLETIKGFHPAISLILNITPDHLDRHLTMENYGLAKARIFENQGKDDVFIVNMDDEGAWAHTKGCKAKVVPFSRRSEPETGVFTRDGRIVIRTEGKIFDVCGIDELKIPGGHNLENALAAVAAAFFAGIPTEIIAETLRDFPGVPHRLEPAGLVGGVKFVNDSKGTNTDAAIKAIEAMDPGIILIAGGYDKHVSFDDFIDAFQGKVKHLLLMGVTAPQIKAAALSKGFNYITECKDMRECVRMGYELASEGDTVLLSPACASWDMYSCFEERGEDFKACVGEL
ncbi:UDP-N-acetylmuramoylalanine--D-glutamate ligase [Clostridia bacterium]|nr:UDP-N-acetylmuramoylalanine--D-glutamate ligase [Clostridia bacterium]